MAIGSPDQAARLDQLRTFARVQVWSGYTDDEHMRAEVFEAVHDEVKDLERAQELTDRFVADALSEIVEQAAQWPEPTAFDRLQAAFAELEAEGVIVLQAVEDHWEATERLEREAARGSTPAGIAYFTHPDVWHAVEHQMLELNVWHGSSANVAPGDDLLELVQRVLSDHGISSLFDEGRIEITLAWQRRPLPGNYTE